MSPGLDSCLNITFLRGGRGSSTDFVTRLEVPSDFFLSTSKEKWRTGRRSPEGDGGAERRTFIFEQEDLISVTGVSSWWGYFAQSGGTPLIMAGIKIWECKLESKSDSVRQGEGYCFKQEESNLITFTFTCSFLYLCLHVFASVLDKDSSELKVLAITINSKVKQAFECSREQSSSSQYFH